MSKAVLAVGSILVATVLAACGGSAKPATVDSGYTPSMQAALKAANRIAVDLTTFDYRTLDAFYSKMKAQGTAYFNQNLQANRAQTTAYDQRLKVVSTGSVIASAAKPASADGSVTVLLFVDERLRSSGAKVGLLEQVRVQMVMKNVNGAWLVDQATVSGSS
ncbi:MAG: hypothetical protein ACTHJM_04525 [Marmoricola sp.]